MEKVLLPNLESIHFTKNSQLFYGGAQDMYQSFWQRRSGCGPTCTTNLFIYASQNKEQAKNLYHVEKVTYNDVLKAMENTWEYVTPTMRGVHRLDLLIDGAKNFAKNRNISLIDYKLDVPKEKSLRPTNKDTFDFLETQINRGFPVAFLNLDNGEVDNLDRWHWVLIVGITYKDDTIMATLYDEGNKKDINITKWLETTKQNGGFVSFDIK